jgi:hypothetical protein
MPIDPPAGFLTRPEAARQFNRSQRALERDLNVALAIKDDASLVHWKLFTKDGIVRDGENVTAEIVKELVDTGMAPAWCIAEFFLQETYGRKGEPRPSRSFMDADHNARAALSASQPSKSVEAIADDTAYLKQIIRTLEQKQDQERARYDQIVEKLFEQLDVKDRQISAWDEVTQGLTKALATGQLKPTAGFLPPGNERSEREPSTRAESTSPIEKCGRRPSSTRIPKCKARHRRRGAGVPRKTPFRRKRNYFRRTRPRREENLRGNHASRGNTAGMNSQRSSVCSPVDREQ